HPGILIGALAILLTVTHSSLTSSDSATSAGDTDNTPLTASTPSSKGGPDQVANPATVGTIKATVRLDGTPPPNKELNLGTCTSETEGPVYADTVLVKEGKLKSAFVYVKK